MKERLIDIYRDDVDAAGNTHQRKDARRYWLKAVMQTLQERSITADPLPRSNKMAHITRYEPFWFAVSDDELHELLDHMRPYFRRPENRSQPL